MPLLLRRHLALPSEHGSWAFLLTPLLIGLCTGGRWTLTSTYLIVAALCAFLVRQPLTRLLKAYTGRGSRREVPGLLLWIGIYGLVGGLHVVGLVMRGHGYLLWLAAPGIPVFAWHLLLVARRQERRQRLMEIVGAGVLALSAPAAHWVGRGGAVPMGWVLWGLTWMHATFTILLAYLRLQQRGWSPDTPADVRSRAGRPPLLAAVASLAVVVVLVQLGVVTPWLVVAYGAQVVVALGAIARPTTGWMPRRIGVRLMLVTLLFTVLFLLGWWAPVASAHPPR